MITVAEAWKSTYPGALVGILAMRNVLNPEQCPPLDARKSELENELRARFSGYTRAAFNGLPSVQPYTAYYSRFKKTYHVQLQLESVVLKAKSLPRVAALVEAMFMAELKNQLLTAGHDLEVVEEPIRLDVGTGDERYTLLSGQEQVTKAGDMLMADAQGIISSVLYGPDQRTRITGQTRQVLFVVYAPAGVTRPMLEQHLSDLQANVIIISPEAEVLSQTIYSADER